MTIQLTVPGMMCEGCVKSITAEIQAHDPQAKVEANLDQKTVTVDTDSPKNVIKDLIVAAGYEVD